MSKRSSWMIATITVATLAGCFPSDLLEGPDQDNPEQSEPSAADPASPRERSSAPSSVARIDAGTPGGDTPDSGADDSRTVQDAQVVQVADTSVAPPIDVDLVPDTALEPDVMSLLSLGTTCSAASECASGHCTDGVCCETACDGACTACNLAEPGRCLDVAEGQAPPAGKICPADATNPCSSDGTCDGRGSCSFTPQGTPCGQNQCVEVFRDTAYGERLLTCDGLGTCIEQTFWCRYFRCGQNDGRCLEQCSSDDDCVSGSDCRGGWCRPPDED